MLRGAFPAQEREALVHLRALRKAYTKLVLDSESPTRSLRLGVGNRLGQMVSTLRLAVGFRTLSGLSSERQSPSTARPSRSYAPTVDRLCRSAQAHAKYTATGLDYGRFRADYVWESGTTGRQTRPERVPSGSHKRLSAVGTMSHRGSAQKWACAAGLSLASGASDSH